MGLDCSVEVFAQAAPLQLQPLPSPLVPDTEHDVIFAALQEICDVSLECTSEGIAVIFKEGEGDPDGEDGHCPLEHDVYTHSLPTGVLPDGHDVGVVPHVKLIVGDAERP